MKHKCSLSKRYTQLQFLVENQGRINQNVMNDFKGLFNVELDDKMLKNWTITGFPLSEAREIKELIRESNSNNHSNRL